MRLQDAARPVFARHETFHPRYGWFRKAVMAAARDPGVFLEPDAPVRLGVGKNMAKAIRFWGLAAQLLTEAPNPVRPRRPRTTPSRIGDALLGEEGWDPWLERPETLWLIHWLLLAPGGQLPVWWAAFNAFGAVEFSIEDLSSAVREAIASTDWPSPHHSAVEKDVSCFLRTYAPSGPRRSREPLDDVLDCPLRELGLLRVAEPRGQRYRWVLGTKPGLSADIVAAVALDYLARTQSKARTVSLSRLLATPGGPGPVLKLTEPAIRDLLEDAAARHPELSLSSAAGVPQLAFDGPPAALASLVLSRFYGKPSEGVVLGPGADAPAEEVHWELIEH